jgi:hypothetical protein
VGPKCGTKIRVCKGSGFGPEILIPNFLSEQGSFCSGERNTRAATSSGMKREECKPSTERVTRENWQCKGSNREPMVGPFLDLLSLLCEDREGGEGTGRGLFVVGQEF